MDSRLKFHHVACLVTDLHRSYDSFLPFLEGLPGGPVEIASQHVIVWLLPLSGGSVLELVSPKPEAQGLFELVHSGQSFYHVAFSTPELDHVVRDLMLKGHVVLTTFHSEAFGGRICVFLRTPTGELVELIQE